MISGFMVVKDVVKQGYPFVEAVASVLPICDEFLISEGYSSDETFEVVQKMAKLNKKIKIFRQKWPSAQNWNVIGKMTNSLREKCKYDYILSIQANEIFHEDSLEFIKYLPKMCPNVNTFSFPFWHMVGNRKFLEEFRLRFSKNLQSMSSQRLSRAFGLPENYLGILDEESNGLTQTLEAILFRVRYTSQNQCSDTGPSFQRIILRRCEDTQKCLT